MNAINELQELANATSRPSEAAAFILCVLEDLIKPEECEAHPLPCQGEHYPKVF